MASIDKFNEHCWKDVIPEADLELYAGWRRETFVGARPALLAIDLYDLVYRGGPHSPNELNARYPNSCGVFAHRAIAPTKRLLAAARRAGIPIFYCTQETRPQNRPKGAVSTRQRIAAPPDGYAIYHEFTAAAGRRHHHQTACQHLPGYTAVLASLAARHSKSHRLRRKHLRLCTRKCGGRLLLWIPCLAGRGMHLRPRRAHP